MPRPVLRIPLAVACGPGSTFVVAWQGDRTPGDARSAIFALQLTRAARAFAPPIRVDAGTADFPRSPALAADRAGNFAVVWEGEQWIAGRRFASSGAPFGAETSIAPVAAAIPAHPAIATAGAGFVVLWRDGAAGLAGRRLNP